MIRIINTTVNENTLKSYEHFCQISHMSCPSQSHESVTSVPKFQATHVKPFSQDISLDPILEEFDLVFEPSVSKNNGPSGDTQAVVNMGSTLPPQ